VITRRMAAALAAVLVLGAAACDDNPVAEGRTDAARLDLSHTNATVEVGGQIVVRANVLNRHGSPTGAGVTAQACDNRVTVTPDTARSAFEYPEQFRVRGQSYGTSCLVVSGGGITDTVNLRVVPAGVRLTRRDTLGSGESAQLSVQFLGAGGQPFTGLGAQNVTFSSADANVVFVDAQGNIQGRAPGTTQVRITFNQLGVTRRDSVSVTVVPGSFGGTVTRATRAAGAADVLTFTQGSIPFDGDTQVRLNIPGYTLPTWFTLPGSPAGQIRVVLPFGVAAGNLSYDVINLGPNQVAQRGTIAIAAAVPANDPLEPDLSLNTPKQMVPGQTFFGALSPSDDEDLIRLTITEAGSYTISALWEGPQGANAGSGAAGGSSDIDLYLLNSTASSVLLARETLANPETGTVTLQPGTYYINLYVYAYQGIAGRQSVTYRVTATRN
jgi:hypothetical protein